jgi:helicase
MVMSQSSLFFTVVFAPSKQENTLQILGFTKGRLNQRKPRFKGKILYFYKREKMWRPRRIFWEEQGKWKAYPPENTIQEIISVAKYIFLTTDLPNKEKDGLTQFCTDFNIPIKFTSRNFCPFCFFTEKFTLLKPEGNYKAYGREICKACAMQELEKELQSKKINLLDNPGFKKYAVSILDRFHDIQPVTETLTQGSANLSELTLVKRIETMNTASDLLTIQNSQIDKYLKKTMKKRGIDTLLPIQAEALKNGLLKNKNQLIIANTSAGKTLIGEIAGITSSLKKNKFLFIVPLVALANTKFEDFKKFYSNKLRIGIRTGRSRIFDSIKEKKLFYKNRFSIQDSDVIIATYEGLDLLIRGGQINFSDIGCIVIDEIQTLADPERGPTLDCLQAKIRTYSKNVQIIGLSATIGNPNQFANDLSLNLVTVDHRPIPLEQHLLISRSAHEKIRQITSLVFTELKTRSKSGYKGQTIIFTNSRRKTSEIAEILRESGIRNAQAYHSGLSYTLRKQIELDFSSGKCTAIVATYALGAGVDFPASQVIFESMMMGNQILDPNTFTQMIGRAGRLGKHDRGYAVFLCLGESISSLESKSEVEIALELVSSDLTPITPDYDENACGEQIISICSTRSKMSPSEVKKIYQNMIGTGNHDFMQITNKMIRNSLIAINSKDGHRYLEVTPLGKASALSFFSPEKTIKIKSLIKKKEHFLSIALEMNHPQNVYLSKKLHAYLEKTYHMRFSTRLINSPVLDVMSASLKGKEATELNKWCLTVFAKWTQNFFTCTCKENPYCFHGSEQIGRYIVNKRLEGKNINQISRSFSKFELLIFPGDILSSLNGIIHELEGIQRIALAIGEKASEKKITLLIDKLEIPQ